MRYAKIDFFDPVVAEDREFDLAEDQASVDLVLSDTYPERITMSAPDADDETFSVVVTFTLEPGRVPLA